METTKIEYRVGVNATPERIWEFIADLGSWNQWNPVETDVEGRIGFGGSIALTERIEGHPERRVTAKVGDWQPYAQLIWREKRGWHFNALRFYEIEELNGGICILSNGIIFSGIRGEWFHDKHKKAIKAAYTQIGDALKAAAET